MTRWLGAGLTLFALAGLGCNADEAKAPTAEPLRQIDIPAEFTFSMSRGIRVQVTADAALSAHGPLAVQVSLPSGGRLYRGPIEAGTPKQVEVLAPRAVEELVVTLSGGAKEVEARVAVAGPTAQVNLR